MTERVCIAQIGAAHGVRGELRLKPFTEDPLSVTRYGPLETEDAAQIIQDLRAGGPVLEAKQLRFRRSVDPGAVGP